MIMGGSDKSDGVGACRYTIGWCGALTNNNRTNNGEDLDGIKQLLESLLD